MSLTALIYLLLHDLKKLFAVSVVFGQSQEMQLAGSLKKLEHVIIKNIKYFVRTGNSSFLGRK